MTVLPANNLSMGRGTFLLRRLHSLTGIMFSGYVVLHLLINATLVQAADVYQVQVDKIHSLPFLWAIEWTFIYIPILYHAIYGIWITLTAQPNIVEYPYLRNWLYIAQRVSAVILGLFVAFHVFSLKSGWFGPALAFDAHHATASIHQHMIAYPRLTWLVYPLGILAACFHLANGLWAAAITWGLTISAHAQRRWGYLCIVLFLIALALAITALLSASRAITGPGNH